MNPIYKFTLSANDGAEQQAFPIYRDDLAKDFELQTNQEFYRAKLSGKLTFVNADYTFITTQSFDTRFGLKIYISYNAGQTWALYWSGRFWKTDCVFNVDDHNVTLTPEVADQYNDVLAGMEKEYNLIELLPETIPIKMDKRPMIQVYVPGDTNIACFLSGMWWEQECERVTVFSQLTETYHFAFNKLAKTIDVSGDFSPALPAHLIQETTSSTVTEFYTITKDGFTFTAYKDTSDPQNVVDRWQIKRGNDILWEFTKPGTSTTIPYEVTLQPVSGSGSVGNVTLYVRDVRLYARYITDVESVNGVSTFEIPADDIVPNNRNYHRCYPYTAPDSLIFSTLLTDTPTKWGIYQPNQYYVEPILPSSGIFQCFPLSRSSWNWMSIWFTFDSFDWVRERAFRKQFTLRDSYPVSSVISVLLAQFAPGITHLESSVYSQFLYGSTNPISGISQTLFITPKTNLKVSGYDQPAQKATITLKSVLDMLRDCFRCYWFIDEQNRFRIEHILYFMNGGRYTGSPGIGHDLTAEEVTRNGKKWAFGTSEYQFEKPEMAARYQFGWMDDVTQLFEGNPIEIISRYVNPENIEEINIAKFTSDVDYILLNPSQIADDGFVLLSASGTSVSSNVKYFLNYLYSNIGGVLFSAPGLICTPYFLLSSVEKITLSQNSLGYWFYNFMLYDANENYIDWASTTDGQHYEIKFDDILNQYPNARYIAVNLYGGSSHPELTPADVADLVIVQYMRRKDYVLPYLTITLNNSDYILQNPYVSFYYLQRYYLYDMPALTIKLNGIQIQAAGIKRLKTQKLKFPMLYDPDTLKLIKTNLGNGVIQKMSVNLSSRNANTTLKYDTE